MSTLSLAADYESAREIGPWLQDRLNTLASPQCDRIGELELAIHEVAVNIVDHAFSGTDSGDYTISLDHGAEPGEIKVQLRDNGAAFVSATAPNIEEPQVGGYGLFIAEQLTSSLSYERVDDTNIWTLTFAATGIPQTQETTP